MNEVIQGDCLDVLRGLPDNSVDLICTDPPYFKVKSTADSAFNWWDRQWDKPAEFLKWLDAIAAQWQRILKPNGSLYCFASPKMSARVELLLGERFNVLNNIRWVKSEGWHKKARKEDARQYQNPWESIIFCEQGFGGVCEPIREYLDSERKRAGLTYEDLNIAIGKPANNGLPSHWCSKSQWHLISREHYEILQSNFPGYFRRTFEDIRRTFEVSAEVAYTDVWEFPTVQPYAGKHPCEKPLAMMEHILTVSSRPGDVVLDCFCGSGSTLVAAKKLGRRFIGIDIDPHWVDVARGRLGQTQQFVSLEDRLQWLETQVQAQGNKIQRLEQQQLSLFGCA